MEGTLIYTRSSINSCFYGRSLPAWQLLDKDSVAPPAAARPLYAALDEVLARVELPLSVAEASRLATCVDVQNHLITGSKQPACQQLDPSGLAACPLLQDDRAASIACHADLP